MNILTLNAGSSTLKYKLFALSEHDAADSAENVLTEGTVEHSEGEGLIAAAEKALGECGAWKLDAIGHLVVHGGDRFSDPTRMTPKLLAELRGLQDLDPLHNPTETAIIEAGMRLLPAVPSFAVFDTAFHRTLPEIAWRYALPHDLTDRLHLRRYGFHGLSYQYVSEKLLACLGRSAEGSSLIVCHLGSGASVCALRDGKSVDTSMGLTPLEGLVMGTRSGDVDPGLLLYLLRSQGMTAETLDDVLNHHSGLLGLSGLSSDVRELEQAAGDGNGSAALALELFAYRVCKYIGAYAAALQGVEAVAFTGGIGEHSPAMRSRICRRLAFLGLHLSDARNKNAGHEPTRISTDSATLQAWVIPTDEEKQIARAVSRLLTGG